MPAHLVDTHGTLTERKERLVLLCAADRAAWSRACRTEDRKPLSLLASLVFEWSDIVGALVPGRLGRLFRGASFFSGLARHLGGLLRGQP